MSNFKSCPKNKYDFKPSDICMNGQNCFYIEMHSNGAEKRKFYKPIVWYFVDVF